MFSFPMLKLTYAPHLETNNEKAFEPATTNPSGSKIAETAVVFTVSRIQSSVHFPRPSIMKLQVANNYLSLHSKPHTVLKSPMLHIHQLLSPVNLSNQVASMKRTHLSIPLYKCICINNSSILTNLGNPGRGRCMRLEKLPQLWLLHGKRQIVNTDPLRRHKHVQVGKELLLDAFSLLPEHQVRGAHALSRLSAFTDDWRKGII